VKIRLFLGTILLGIVACIPPAESQNPTLIDDPIILYARNRVETGDGSGEFNIINNRQEWKASETALIICDMWDQHWCKSATRRVTELAPFINRFVLEARKKGIFIVHSPSEVINHYKDFPARNRAKNAKKAKNLPEGISEWCDGIKGENKETWPIDQSDGGCDCIPPCKSGSPWSKQIDSIEIQNKDAISDSGIEIWNMFEQRNIKNVILVGVHTNMCVVGRPFGLRNMKRFGKNVVLCRDLTDTMYNPRKQPYVSHFAGTDLVVEHIEKFICPTITSTTFLGKAPFYFKNDQRPRVVFISAESEYDANRSLPALAHQLVEKHGLYCEILQGSTQMTGKNRNYIPDMQALVNTDLAILFARRRVLPPDQMNFFQNYLNNGGPLIAFRTSSHAFALRGELPEGLEQWSNFDHDVLGCNYAGYPLGETLVTVVPEAVNHPILKGLEGPYQVRETMYRSQPLAETCQLLLMGKCVNGQGENPRYLKKPGDTVPDEPVAWVNNYKGSKVFYTSLGNGRASFRQPWFQRMIINAIYWALDKPIP